MNRQEYEAEFDLLAEKDPLVKAVLDFHETDRANLSLATAMKIIVVELAKHNAELLRTAQNALMSAPLPPFCLCKPDEACSNPAKNPNGTKT